MTKLRDECRSVLEGFFSAPIAKAIVGAAAKAAARSGNEDTPLWQVGFERELQRLLGVYLPDQDRRVACLAQMSRISPHGAADSHFASSEHTPAPALARSRQPSGSYPRPSQLVRRESETLARVLAPSMRPATLGAASTSVVVRDQTDIPNACEVVRDLGKKLGFSRVDQTKMATAVSELARNMLQYAGGGTIRFAEVLAPRRGLEAFFEDHGPGIVGLDDILEAGSMGLGLRGSKGIADEFTIDTQPGDGTRITMRKYVA